MLVLVLVLVLGDRGGAGLGGVHSRRSGSRFMVQSLAMVLVLMLVLGDRGGGQIQLRLKIVRHEQL